MLPSIAQQFFPVEGELSSFFGEPSYMALVLDVVHSGAFQRLRDIRFLGAIDYLIYPSGSFKRKRHTRWDHSLGVARLACEYARACKLEEKDARHLVVAGLLHDIGHGPMSHSLEPVFKEKFRISHHVATELVIKGQVPIGSMLPRVFHKHGIDPKEIIELIVGTSSAPHVEAFRNPINIDTIEGICRAHTYLVSANSIPSPTRILHAMIKRDFGDESILDGFWKLKDTVYKHVINNRSGIIADYVCRAYMRKNASKFWSGNYFLTETELRKAHPGLFFVLKKLQASPSKMPGDRSESIEYQKRSFVIDKSVSIREPNGLYKRYLQAKEVGRLDVEGSCESSDPPAYSKQYQT